MKIRNPLTSDLRIIKTNMPWNTDKNRKPSTILLYALRKNTTYSLRHNLLHKKNSQRDKDSICHEKRRNVLSKWLEIFV